MDAYECEQADRTMLERHVKPAAFGPGNPNPAPGYYYVSVIDGRRTAMALGPFLSHADALAAVEPVRAWCNERNRGAWFWSFGTCRLKDEETDEADLPVGKLNQVLELSGLLPAVIV